VEDGKVKEAFVEPDNAGLNGKLMTASNRRRLSTDLRYQLVSAAEKVLG